MLKKLQFIINLMKIEYVKELTCGISAHEKVYHMSVYMLYTHKCK